MRCAPAASSLGALPLTSRTRAPPLLNVFVLVVQLFQKFPGLIAIAPTQKDPAFIGTQLLILAIFALLGRSAVRGYGAPASAA